MNPTAEQAVASIDGIFGRHPAARAAHARGTVCRGVFTASADAARLTRAAHMQGRPVEVIARLSNASGDPGAPDSSRDARGLAVKFDPDGDATDIVAVTLPCFFVSEPDAFVAMNRALARRAPLLRPLRVARFLLGHRESWRAAWASARLRPVPSYANCRFNALHTFRWLDRQGRATHVRYGWFPEEGEAALGRAEARRLRPDHLQQDLYERLGRTPARPLRFILQLELAPEAELAGGRAFDPTRPWPATCRRVEAGWLELTRLDHGGHRLVFDPARVTDGIEAPEEDALLQFRPQAYQFSANRRAV